MDALYWKALIQGIIQGITEFLPVSSTGHMILADQFLQMEKEFAEMFEVVIQFGSILAVVVYFRQKVFPVSLRKNDLSPWFFLWLKIAAAVVPVLIVGGLIGKTIQGFCYNAPTVAGALIVGGIVLIAADSRERGETSLREIAELPWKKAIGIGCCQCAALVPGVSRSASTIIGGMFLGCSRELAAEFSFFLAIPTMLAATVYSLWKHGMHLNMTQWIALGIGFVTAFLVAWGVIAFLMAYIRKHDFKPFGYYRIVLGVIVFIWFFSVKGF